MKTKKLSILLILIICISIGGFKTPVFAESFLSEDQEKYIESLGTLKVAILDNVAPLMYLDKDGDFKGISVLVMDKVASLLGLDIEYVSYQSLEDLYQGGFDIFLTATPNYINNNIYLSNPYFRSEQVLMYNKKLQPHELEGKRHGIISGGKIPSGVKEEDIIEFKSREDVINALENRKIDYAYGNMHSLAFYDLQNSYKNISYVPTGDPPREYSFGVTEEYIEFISILNLALANIDETRMNTFVLEAISAAKQKFTLRTFIDEYLYIIAILVLLFIAYIIWTNIRLKNNIITIKKNEEEIKKLSYYDSLTELYNRRYMEEELERANRHRTLPISLIVGDVNGLKLVNDSLGHQAGDTMLVNIAKILKKSCRAEDIIARYGGDEFLVVLYNTPLDEAEAVIERVKENCKESCIRKLPLSISLGCASKTTMEESIYDIFKIADNNMYKNKSKESALFKEAFTKSLDLDTM